MELNEENLDSNYGLFSKREGLMVTQERYRNGKWCVQVESFVNAGSRRRPLWSRTYAFFVLNDGRDRFPDVQRLLAAHPELAKARDWVDGGEIQTEYL
jgi:hypothetical protein